MKAFSFVRYTVGIAASLALLAGCSAIENMPQSGYGGHGIGDLRMLFAMPSAARHDLPATQHPLTHSWMHQPPKGTSGTIWATDDDYASVDLIAYPSGTLIGQVTGFSSPEGDCSDKNGNVYVADSSGRGYEIQAGTTSIINSWNTGGEAVGCSVSNSGDVSFTNFYPGGVVVFPGGGATGTTYAGPGFNWPAGYDPHGNLFVECDYVSPCSSPRLAELPAGGSSWIFLTLNKTINFPAAVQNMGKYLGVADQDVNGQNVSGIDLVKISGSTATVVKTITLNGAGCSNYMDFAASWGSISKQPNGVVTKKIKGLIAPNLWCFPTPINVYKAKGGDPIGSINAVHYQYDYGITFTKP